MMYFQTLSVPKTDLNTVVVNYSIFVFLNYSSLYSGLAQRSWSVYFWMKIFLFLFFYKKKKEKKRKKAALHLTYKVQKLQQGEMLN